MVKPHDTIQFCKIKSTLITHNIGFVSTKLPEDHFINVVLRGIPIFISPEELKSELEMQNFNIKLVKRFYPAEKSMPMCLVINNNSKDIYELSEILELRLTHLQRQTSYVL